MADDTQQQQQSAPPPPKDNQQQSAPPAEDYRAKYEELNQRWTQTEPRLKTLEKWEKWGDPDQFEKNLATNAQRLLEQKRAEWEAEQQRRQAPQQARDPFEGFELLTPQQQAQVIRDQVAAQAEAKAAELINQKWSEAQNQLGQMDQRFSLLSRALSARAENPDLDLNGLWKEASTLATGDQNKLFELAVERLLAPKKLEKQIADAVSAEKLKWEQEQRNRDQAALVGAGNGASSASFKETLAARKAEGDKESLRTRILREMLSKGEITPGQV